MTAFLRAFLACTSCAEIFDTSTIPSARSVTEAREDARKYGWVRRRQGRKVVDLCRECAEAPAA